ncbi:hypothetical protein ACA348_11830 [Orientia tsutsugamushi]|uniref:hypothetical protein n=1 Tax=Orientia tsutsugamushi TaxID=784 RepID=UPI003528670C
MILYSYATFQMLASSIPMLSWGVLKACAHATANLASQFSPIPVASSLGSNIVDNNLSKEFENFTAVKEYEQKLQILKKYS